MLVCSLVFASASCYFLINNPPVSNLYPLTPRISFFFFFNDTATTEIYTLSLHDALPISLRHERRAISVCTSARGSEVRGKEIQGAESNLDWMQSEAY